MLRILPLLVFGILIGSIIGGVVGAKAVTSGYLGEGESNVLGICTGGNCGVVTNLPWTRDDTHGITKLSNSGDKVGIGTGNPSGQLDVSGSICLSGDCISNWTSAAASIPSGFVGYFNSASCPSGWSVLTAALGRYIVGLPSGGTLAGTAGSALTNLEDRPSGGNVFHFGEVIATYFITGAGGTQPEDGWAYSMPSTGSYVAGSYTLHHSGGSGAGDCCSDFALLPDGGGHATRLPAGTNAPYIQLLPCQKN